jgi:Protein of unknown function (DUF4239)
MTTADIHLILLLIVFLCTFGGALTGLLIRAVLPAHHFDDQAKGAVNVAAATVSVLTALVISSLITSARGAFETATGEVEELSADLILLDRVMAHYGPQADPARDLLRRYAILKIDLTWPKDPTRRPVLDDPAALELLETLQDELRALEPKSEAQRWLQSRALQVSGDLAQTRWKLAVQNASVIPRPFLMVVVAWLTFLFASFGLFAPRNPTVITVLLVAALSVSAAIVLILELDNPFDGFITISADPMQNALAHLQGS